MNKGCNSGSPSRKDCYIIPKGKEDRKEEIILHNLICRDANVSDCEEADRIAKVLVKAGYVRFDKVTVLNGKKQYEMSPKTLDEMCRRLGYVKKDTHLPKRKQGTSKLTSKDIKPEEANMI